MEQLYSAMLPTVQAPQERPAAKAEASGDKDGFQKLMEQKQGSDAPAETKQERTGTAQKDEPKAETQNREEAEAALPRNEKELEQQLALAAMAMLQNPVVPMEQAMSPELQAEAAAAPVAAEEAAPLVMDAVLAPEEQAAAAPETEQKALEIPVEDGTVRETAVQPEEKEELPQTMEAPEAAEKTEGRTVEVKVETGEERPQAEKAPEDAGEEDAPELQDAEVETPVFENVKAAPVKVGEAPKAEEPRQIVEKQIGPKVAEALENGETRVEIQLEPEHLGKVKVEMTLKEDGSLVVQLHAENRGTQSLLEKNLSGLEALLGRQTQQEVHVEVPRQEESQRQDLYDQQQSHHREQQQQQEQRRNRQDESENFLQQLRLGLIPMDGE